MRALLVVLLRGLLCLAALVISGPAQATAYVFPGHLPAGCSGSGPSYTCPAGYLQWGDTVTINSPKPATITVTGDLALNSAQINPNGAASDLNLIVTGTLTPGFMAVINANLTVGAISAGGSSWVSFGGNVTGGSGTLVFADNTSFDGDISTTTGSITLGMDDTVSGNVTSSGGAAITVGYSARVYGNVSTTGAITLNQNARVDGAVTGGTGAVSIGYAATVVGDLTTSSGTIGLTQSAVASACVQSTSAASITLGWGVSVAKVCCGALGSCSTSCVANNSFAAMPAVCAVPTPATLLGKYEFQEASWNATAGELKDTAGHASGPFNGVAKGSPLPTADTASPARSGRTGTCGYAALAGPAAAGGGFTISGLPVSTTGGQQTTVAFWMYWDGDEWTMPVGFQQYDLWFANGGFGFNTSNSDLYGTASTGLANGWHHVVAVFTNGGVSSNKLWIDGTQKVLTQRWGTPLNGSAVVATSLQVGGWGRDTGYRFSGRIDQLRVYKGAVTSGQVATLYAETLSCGAALDLVAGNRYSLESVDLPGSYVRHRTSLGWVEPISAGSSATEWSDATFIARAGLYNAACWSFESVNYPGYYLRHFNFRIRLDVAASDTLYKQDTTFCEVNGRAGSTGITLESVNYPGYYLRHLDDLTLGISTPDGTATYNARATFNLRAPWAAAASLHHVEIRHASGAGLTCTPGTITVRACQDAACSTLYTGGLTGTLSATGSGMTVNWPAGAGFSIAAGSSSTTADLQLVSAGSVLLGSSGLSPAASNATTCNFGSPSCTWTAADSGLLFDVPNHVAGTAQTVSISAVKKADNSLACVPAFASVSKSINFRCTYNNPGSGTRAVTVGGSALNGSNSANAACDGSGRSASLGFNASGVASTTVQYNDVGQLTLTASYAGSGNDAGLAMSGSDSFVAAPAAFGFSAITAGPIMAGSDFGATLTAYNSAGTVTPNFGRESSAESARIAFVRIQPSGNGAASGSFSGSLGAFSGGTAGAGNLNWTEVGRGDLLANLTSGSYLGSGLSAYGASPAAGATSCATENGTCTLPAASTATVYYGAVTSYAVRTGVTGSIGCNNTVFGDPIVGAGKHCFYVLTSASNGSVGNFIPHHFDVTTMAACGSFSYAGQPFTATVTARNAGGTTTVNYDGSAATSPNFAKTVTLGEAAPLNVGSLGGNSIAASAFSAGVAGASPSYSFSTKQTVPKTLLLRATDADNPSPTGYTEGSMALRSGRLRISNAFGSAGTALQVPVVAEYWSSSDKAWVLNSADSCTVVPAASVARSNPRTAGGASSAASSSASAISLAGGSAVLTLGAPTPAGSSLTLDLALNLGTTGTDQSCQTNHPATIGAAKAWLRAQNGACAATEDRDPAARASFGIFSPESRKTVHVREIF